VIDVGLDDLIAPKWKMVLAILLIIAVLAAAFGAGAVVNGWRLGVAHAAALAEKDESYNALNDLVREQNRAVEKMAATSDAADQRRKVAEHYASGVIARLGDRATAVNASRAPDCDGVLREAWGQWK
jgi:hypothetical protein